jgi:hypothetical protein
MSGYHPDEPHWYLPLLGVDPLRHGKGLGSATTLILFTNLTTVTDHHYKHGYKTLN